MDRAASHRITSGARVERDEELLRAGRPSVRAEILTDRSLSIGVQTGPIGSCLAAARRLGIEVTRRRSGGTGVLTLPGDIAWTMVLPRSDPRLGRDFLRAYDRWGAPVVELLESRGLHARWGPPPGRSKSLCPLGSGGQVLWNKGRVVGAAAQHLAGGALLHHGLLFWTHRIDLAQTLWPEDAAAIGELLGSLGPPEPMRSAEDWAIVLQEILERWLDGSG
ncbi:MAG: lipoyl protein ligase domain-containing protein [Thermoplasmata archaeon]